MMLTLYLDVRPAGALSAHHVAVVVEGTARVAVAGLAAVDVVRQAKVLGATLVTVATNYVTLTPTLTLT